MNPCQAMAWCSRSLQQSAVCRDGLHKASLPPSPSVSPFLPAPNQGLGINRSFPCSQTSSLKDPFSLKLYISPISESLPNPHPGPDFELSTCLLSVSLSTCVAGIQLPTVNPSRDSLPPLPQSWEHSVYLMVHNDNLRSNLLLRCLFYI